MRIKASADIDSIAGVVAIAVVWKLVKNPPKIRRKAINSKVPKR